MLLVPVKVGGQTVGVICADQDAYGWFSRSSRRLVEALSRHVGIAMERAMALDLLRKIGKQILRKTEMASTLQEIVTGAVKLTHTSSGIIYLVEKTAESYRITNEFQHPHDLNQPKPRLDQNTGITYEVVTTRRSVVIPDTSADHRVNPELLSPTADSKLPVRSIIAVPLILGTEAIGVLHLNDTQFHNFSEIEQTVLSTLADQAAIAIEKAERYERISQKLIEQIAERQIAYEKLEQAQEGRLAAERLVQANAIGMQFAHFLGNIAGTIPSRVMEIQRHLDSPDPNLKEIARSSEMDP